MSGEIIDEAEIGGVGMMGSIPKVTATLRFVDWERPDHRDTQGHAVPRYSLRVETDDGRASFTAWGSIREAQTGEPTGTAREFLGMVAREAQMLYDCGADPAEAETFGGVAGLHDEHGDVIDEMAHAWGIEDPSEAVRVFSALWDHAEKFLDVGLARDELAEVSEQAERAQVNDA